MGKVGTAEVLRLRATNAVSRDKSVRRSAQDDGFVGILKKTSKVAPVLSLDSHQRVQIAVIASEINHPAGDHRRRKNRAYALYFGDAGEHVVIEIGNIHCL